MAHIQATSFIFSAPSSGQDGSQARHFAKLSGITGSQIRNVCTALPERFERLKQLAKSADSGVWECRDVEQRYEFGMIIESIIESSENGMILAVQ
jgi:hypothetical protein